MKSLIVCAVLAGLAFPAVAQTHRNEISVAGSWDDVREPADVEVTNVQLRYGRFMSPQLVATGGLHRTRFQATGLDTATTAFTVGAKYYINAPRQGLVPFVDAAVGVAMTDTGSSDSSDFTWELGGGAAYFLTERTSLDAGIRFYHTDTDAATRGTRLFVGLTTRF
jgi:opacity protein-like surface antigen